MSDVRIVSRQRLTRRFLSAGRYHVEGAWWKAVETAEGTDSIINPRDFGPPLGRVALIAGTHPLAPIVSAVLQGRRDFSRREVEEAAGGPLSEMEVLRRLADVGLGLLSVADDEVALKSAGVRLAHLVAARRRLDQPFQGRAQPRLLVDGAVATAAGVAHALGRQDRATRGRRLQFSQAFVNGRRRHARG